MKTILLFLAFTVLTLQSFSQSSSQANLPGPQKNKNWLREGSYVIAMDNTWQLNDDTKPTNRYFNLKAYGLVVFLLNNNVPIKRIISSGKSMGAPDFSAYAVMIKPTAEGRPTFRDFKTGPFVINAADLPDNIDALIDIYNTTPSVSGITNANYKVKVYRITSDVQVDVRYDMTGFKPKAGIMNDGGNYAIQSNYFVLAGVPATNYAVTYAANLTVNCFTFASEPHNDKVTFDIKQKITDFVKNGGNFLAECAAIPTYENEMHFHSDSGITVTNNAVTTINYPNPDLAYSQIEGAFNIKNGGSCQNWKLSPGSSFINNGYIVAGGTNSNGETVIGAAASKLTGASKGGGMVFYLGNHSYTSITDYVDINGIRMYMNAFLTPPLDGVAMQYTYQTAYKKMHVNAPSGPHVGYPVKFKLYADKGYQPGVIDTLDVAIGTAIVTGPGQSDMDINISDQYALYTPYVMSIQPGSDCVAPAETVVPPPFTVQVLPVEFSFFNAKRNNTVVTLTWETAQEINNSGFTVQCKQGDDEWKDVAFLPSAVATGNSSGPLDYSFDHVNNYKGVSQYRIAQVDKVHNIKYSEVRQVVGVGSNSSVIIYPNPATNGTANMLFDKTAPRNIYLQNAAGQLIKQWVNNNSMLVQINQLAPGMYIIKIDDLSTNTSQMQKLIVH